MSLIRRFSKKISGSSKKNKVATKHTHQADDQSLQLFDKPMPNSRTLTSANLFQQVQSTSAQSTAMDRTLYEIPQPQKVNAMSDLLKDHTDGDLFPYVGVVGSEGESSDARRARMLALKPSYNKRDIPEVKVLGCPLISREGNFTMESLMSYAKVNAEQIPHTSGPIPNGIHSPNYQIIKPYVHIRQVTILYTPNMSSTSNYCGFWMNLVDNRLIDSDKGSQTNVIVSNQEGIMEMSCDYCVSTTDLQSFTLSYTLERDVVHPGFQWGTASFYFSITESDLPYQSSKVDAMAVYRMPITTLMDRATNADKSDISFTPADIARLRDLYSRGDVVDVDQPKRNRPKVNTYSKSSIRTKPKGTPIDVGNKAGWEFMSGARKQMIDAFEASVDDNDDSSVSIRIPNTDIINATRQATLNKYKEQQESTRAEFINSPVALTQEDKESTDGKEVAPMDTIEEQDELTKFFGPKKDKKLVRMAVSDV
jgi:hypothetical protein